MVGLWVMGLAIVATLAFTVGGAFTNDFRIADSESQVAFDVLQERFPEYSGDALAVPFRAEAGVDDPAVRATMEGFFAGVATLDGVREVVSPYSGPMIKSPDAKTSLAQVRLDAFGPSVDPALVRDIIARAEDVSEGEALQVAIGGPTAMFAELEPPGAQEGLGVAIALLILLVTFGSFIAAGLPILVALTGLGAGMALILILTRAMDIFTFAPAMAAMIGLGVGIDYALFIVTRYRQGLSSGLSPEDATVLAINTSGRAVIFAGATVVISLLGMILLGVSMVVGMAVSASLAVVCTVLAAITLLPATLGFIGHSIDRFAIRGLHRAEHEHRQTVWYRWSRQVQRHPWPALAVSLVVLLGMSLPVLDLQLGGPHFGAGPTSQSSRRAYDIVTEGFGEGFNGPLIVVAQTDPSNPAHTGVLAGLVERINSTEGVVFAAPPQFNEVQDTAVITVIPETAPNSTATQDLVHRLRENVIPEATSGTGVVGARVSGVTALFVDMADLMGKRLPLFIGMVILLSFMLLLVVFRSILVPLKAALMNLLSIGAAYGVVVAVFQWGWGAGLIGVERTGPIMAFLPMMLFAILFGLSMDYEVFLLSRVREEYDHSGDNASAVADGLAATARVITAAAAIMVFIFLSFVFGDDPIVKTFGLGLAVAVFIDATVVRMILVPATMELLGDANWWFPKWLDRIVPRLTLEAQPAPAMVTFEHSPRRPVAVSGGVVSWLESLAPHARAQALADLDRALTAEPPTTEFAVAVGLRTRRLWLSPGDDPELLIAAESFDASESAEWPEVLSRFLADVDVKTAHERARMAHELGAEFKALRQGHELTPAELADRAGTTPDVVDLVEQGSGRVELAELAGLVVALGVRPGLTRVDDATNGKTTNGRHTPGQ